MVRRITEFQNFVSCIRILFNKSFLRLLFLTMVFRNSRFRIIFDTSIQEILKQYAFFFLSMVSTGGIRFSSLRFAVMICACVCLEMSLFRTPRRARDRMEKREKLKKLIDSEKFAHSYSHFQRDLPKHPHSKHARKRSLQTLLETSPERYRKTLFLGDVSKKMSPKRHLQRDVARHSSFEMSLKRCLQRDIARHSPNISKHSLETSPKRHRQTLFFCL